MQKALFFKKIENKQVECLLCPHNCIINDGNLGICKVRKNIEGELYATTYGKLCSINIDPIEKKPLYNFHPGKNILSIGSLGCNLKCDFCQNWEISQTNIEKFPFFLKEHSPKNIAEIAKKKKDNIGIAYTYNEPIVGFEMIYDTSKLVHENGQKNVLVTNGYITKEPLVELFKYIDAFSVDLKAFENGFFKKHTASNLEPVKQSLLEIKKASKHLEIVNLVITDLNDNVQNFREMVKWIKEELGKDTILHISRYFPSHKIQKEPTSQSILIEFYEIASMYLSYVYLGNLMSKEGNKTYCHDCKKEMIERTGYMVEILGLDQKGSCKYCGTRIIENM